MKMQTVALFGESGKGCYRQGYVCETLPQLIDSLGYPPKDSYGMHYAIQTILHRQRLIFFRVQEEGFSCDDYFYGVTLLRNYSNKVDLSAIFAPGVGNSEIIDAMSSACLFFHSILITTEADLYDYLTEYSRLK